MSTLDPIRAEIMSHIVSERDVSCERLGDVFETVRRATYQRVINWLADPDLSLSYILSTLSVERDSVIALHQAATQGDAYLTTPDTAQTALNACRNALTTSVSTIAHLSKMEPEQAPS